MYTIANDTINDTHTGVWREPNLPVGGNVGEPICSGICTLSLKGPGQVLTSCKLHLLSLEAVLETIASTPDCQ
jgi:hypothetical protein